MPAQPTSVPPVYAAAQAAARACLAGPFATYSDEVKASVAAMRQLFNALDAAGPGAPPPDWECLRGRPGVRLEPISWAELRAILADGGERALGTLGRTPLQVKHYHDTRDREILRDHASVNDYLLIRVFGFPAEQRDGKRVAVVPPGYFRNNGSGSSSGGSAASSGGSTDGGGTSRAGAASAGASGNGSHGGSAGAAGAPSSSSGGGSGDGFKLVTVWRDNDFPYHFEPGISHINLWANRPLSAAEVEAEIRRRVPEGVEYAWFVNTPALQSVPAIWHAHVAILEPAMAPAAGGSSNGKS